MTFHWHPKERVKRSLKTGSIVSHAAYLAAYLVEGHGFITYAAGACLLFLVTNILAGGEVE